jgi:hypothetical protein
MGRDLRRTRTDAMKDRGIGLNSQHDADTPMKRRWYER